MRYKGYFLGRVNVLANRWLTRNFVLSLDYLNSKLGELRKILRNDKAFGVIISQRSLRHRFR